MATAYTSLLGLALPVTGELAGTWGDTVNNSITSLLDSAVSGTTTLSTDADVTLTTTTGASNQARQAILLCSGARTVLRNITAPAQSKLYVVINSTTGGFGVVIRGVGPTTGVTVANGKTAVVVWNGTDFVEVAPAVATNLSGGTAGAVPYQTAANTTTFLAIGAANYVLTSTGAAPTWTLNTGTGSVVRATSPTLVTPLLGTPQSGTLTNCTGLPISTGVSGLGAGIATFLATPSSANLAAAVTDETGTGALVFGTSPTITTPTITTSATIPLLIGGTGTTSTLTLRSTSGVGTTGADIIFQTGNNGATEAARILNNGNMGIGTTSPTSKLTVAGTFYATGDTTLGDATTDTVTVAGYMSVGSTPVASQGLRVIPSALTGTFQFGSVLSLTATSAATAGVEGARVQAGTAAAVFTTGYAAGLWVRDALRGAGSTITNNYGIFIDEKVAGTNNYGLATNIAAGANKWNLHIDGTAASYFAGNVGVGTTSPTSPLTIGTATAIGLLINGQTTGASYISITNTGGAYVAGVNNNTGNAVTNGLAYSSFVGTNNATALQLTTNGAVRATVDSSGNVGIGVTPSAWRTVAGTKALQIGIGGALFSQDSSGTYWTVLSSNGFQNTSNVDAYINTGFATAYTQTAGKHIWTTAPSGTAGTTITFTQAMTLDASGNLGIGTATPVNKLDVNGSIGRNAPVTKATSFTLAATENWVICNGTATITVTLPAASSWTGREVMLKTVAAFTVVSASSNVVPLAGGAAGTAILAATAGKWVTLVSDGTNWITMAGA